MQISRLAVVPVALAVAMRGEPGRDPLLLDVSASAESPLAAQRATANAMGAIIEANFVTAHRERSPGVQFRAVQPPDLPKTPRRDTTRNSTMGSGVGLFVGAAIAFAAHRRRREMDPT